MDSLNTVQSIWTSSRVSMDIIPRLFSDSNDNVQGDCSQCPEYPWTLSRLSPDSMTMCKESMESVHILQMGLLRLSRFIMQLSCLLLFKYIIWVIIAIFWVS